MIGSVASAGPVGGGRSVPRACLNIELARGACMDGGSTGFSVLPKSVLGTRSG